MNIEPFPGLSLPYFSLLLLMFVLVGLEIGLYRKRQSGWAVAFWLPVFLIAFLSCCGIASRVFETYSLRSGPGDLSGLAALFDFCLLSPWIVILLGTLISIPKLSRQRFGAWMVGALIFAVILVGLFIRSESSEATNFVALGPDGAPIPHQRFLIQSSYYGNPHVADSVTSGFDGTFSIWLRPEKSFYLQVDDSSDNVIGRVSLWDQEGFASRSKTHLATSCDWEVPGKIGGLGSYPVSLVIGQKTPVAIILKSAQSLTSPFVEAQVRSELVQARDTGTCPLDLSKVVANPEGFDHLDLIADVMAKRPALRAPLLQGLQWSAQFIDHANKATNLFYFYHGNDDKKFRPLLLQWLGLRVDQGTLTFGNVSSVFRQAVDARALRLISVLNPYFGTEPDASDDVREMGPEGRSAIQDFAQSFPTATKQCQDRMLQCLWALQPSVSDLAWLVQSNDPHLVFAGYEAAKDTIKPDERALAKQRVDAALKKATDPHDLYLGKILSETLGRSK